MCVTHCRLIALPFNQMHPGIVAMVVRLSSVAKVVDDVDDEMASSPAAGYSPTFIFIS